MRRIALVTVVAGALLLSACSGSPDPASSSSVGPSSATSTPPPTRTSAPPDATPTATASPIDTATPDPSTSPTAAALVPVTGYGAPLSVWATRHTSDERFDPGAMWDPTPGWGPDEANNDKYNDLVLSNERVLGYVLYLPRPSVSAAKATTAALVALPSDVTVVWKQAFPGCSVVQLRSPSLGKVLAPKPYSNPQGQVQLVLRSGTGTAPSTAFTPTAVASVAVRNAIAATPKDFTGC